MWAARRTSRCRATSIRRVLLAPWEAVEREARAVLARAGGRDGHIFNLGHGVLPTTPPETPRSWLVDLVHERNGEDA